MRASVLVAVLIALLLGLVQPANAAPAPQIVVPGGPCGDADLGVNCQAYFPDLVKDPKGDADDLLMVYRWSSEHARKPSQLRMMRSRDGGATWTQATPFIVADATGVDFRDPSLATMRSGRLLLSYFTATATGVVLATEVRGRDADNTAFSAPSRVYSSTIPSPVTSAKIVELTNGQLLIPLYGTPSSGGKHTSVVVASVDGGVTWDGRITGRQKTIASGSLYYQEPAIAEVRPGHVRALIRVATTSSSISGNAVQTDSYDNTYMTTWSTPSSLGVPMHAPELLAIPGTTHVPYLWSQPNATTSPTNRPTRIAVRRDQVPWADTPQHTLYDPVTTTDAGYSGTVALGVDHLVTVLYDRAKRAAVVLRYPVSDVD
jgi:hypothetical protein